MYDLKMYDLKIIIIDFENKHILVLAYMKKQKNIPNFF